MKQLKIEDTIGIVCELIDEIMLDVMLFKRVLDIA